MLQCFFFLEIRAVFVKYMNKSFFDSIFIVLGGSRVKEIQMPKEIRCLEDASKNK